MAKLTSCPGIHKTWKVASTKVGISGEFRFGTFLFEAKANATLSRLRSVDKATAQPSTFVSFASDRLSSAALIEPFFAEPPSTLSSTKYCACSNLGQSLLPLERRFFHSVLWATSAFHHCTDPHFVALCFQDVKMFSLGDYALAPRHGLWPYLCSYRRFQPHASASSSRRVSQASRVSPGFL